MLYEKTELKEEQPSQQSVGTKPVEYIPKPDLFKHELLYDSETLHSLSTDIIVNRFAQFTNWLVRGHLDEHSIYSELVSAYRTYIKSWCSSGEIEDAFIKHICTYSKIDPALSEQLSKTLSDRLDSLISLEKKCVEIDVKERLLTTLSR